MLLSLIFVFKSTVLHQRQTGPEISRRYWYWYFMGPWIETDTDTDTQTQSTSRPILILIPWIWTGTDIDTDTLLNKNSAKTFQKMFKALDRYRYWYRDSRNAWIETDTDTSCLGIGTFDTIPIFPSVSGRHNSSPILRAVQKWCHFLGGIGVLSQRLIQWTQSGVVFGRPPTN